MFIYSWLHLAGYELSLEQVKQFRQLGSETPGHPEFGDTVGVEATTGPLGQGIGNAVGFAISGKRAAARFNTPEHSIFFNQHIIALHGDGCLQEGVAKEAIAFAGHNKLDNLILIYDSNDVTLDAMADQTQSEQAELYFQSQGWDAVTIDGQCDLAAFSQAFIEAKAQDNGRLKVIIAMTTIAKGIPEVEGSAAGHGEGGAKFAEAARLGLASAERFYVSSAMREYFADYAAKMGQARQEWDALFAEWKLANPALAGRAGSRGWLRCGC